MEKQPTHPKGCRKNGEEFQAIHSEIKSQDVQCVKYIKIISTLRWRFLAFQMYFVYWSEIGVYLHSLVRCGMTKILFLLKDSTSQTIAILMFYMNLFLSDHGWMRLEIQVLSYASEANCTSGKWLFNISGGDIKQQINQ